MRRSILAITLATVLSLALSGAAAAGQASPSLEINGPVMFFSILGGNSNGYATLSGDISDGSVGNLRGSVNFAIRDESLTISPANTYVLATEEIPVSWQLLTCDMFCNWTFGTATFERRSGVGPVDVRLGSLKGSGTLSLKVIGSCVRSCPPAGAYYYPPTSAANLNAAVIGSKDAGTFNMFAVPVIR